MLTAQTLKDKYGKEAGKSFRSVKGVGTRLQKAAKAGLTTTEVEVSEKALPEVQAALAQGGYTVETTGNVVRVSW